MTRSIHKIVISTFSVILSLSSCVSDGVEYDQDYTNSDTPISDLDSTANNTEEAQYHFELGLNLAMLDKDTIGDYDGAIQELNKAIELDPNFQKAYHYRSIIYSIMGNPNEAMSDINKALEIDPNSIESLFVHAGLLIETGDYENAIKDLDAIIRIDPSNGKAYDRRGYAKYESGDKDGGCSDLSKARDLGYMIVNQESDKILCK